MVRLTPDEVLPRLKRHLLVDGFEMVVDLEKSQGQYLYDTLHNRKYLDMFSYFASAPLGHNHPALATPEFKERLLRAATMKPSNSDFYTAEMAEFVETFSSVAVPDYLPHLFFIDGGALGVENALKAAFDWKVRKNLAAGKGEKGYQVIHFQEAFHGRTGYTLSLTNTADPRKTKYFPKFNWPRIVNPKLSFPVTDQVLEQVREVEAQAIFQIERALEENPDDIAAIIIEPIQGEGGDNHFRPEFLQRLRQIADENDVMLIFDEVQTGLGLTGWMWAHQGLDVEPDMLAFGKKTQVCGFMCGRRIDEVEDNVFVESSRLNSTWGGNLADMVRATKYLEVIRQENLLENARRIGSYMLHELHKLAEEFDGAMSNVRGAGLMIAFDLPNEAVRDRFLRAALDNGMIVLGCGVRSVRFRPALNVTQEHVDEGIDIARQSLKKVLSERGGERVKSKESMFEL
jgi:L-lysine 6-transaminase